MRFKKYIFLTLILLFSSSVWALDNLSVQTVASPLIGKPAPDYPLYKLDGTTSSVIGDRQGGKAILIFWATWCPHCYEDLGNIYGHWQDINHKGIKIILLNVGETKEQIQAYFKRRQMKLMSFLDEDSYLSETYHLNAIPAMIFVDDKGIIRSITHAFPSDYEKYFNVK